MVGVRVTGLIVLRPWRPAWSDRAESAPRVVRGAGTKRFALEIFFDIGGLDVLMSDKVINGVGRTGCWSRLDAGR